jgi:hypothetical protein
VVLIKIRGGDPQFFGVQTQLERVFIEEKEIRGNNFFVVSLFSRGCWSSRDNLFIEWVIRLSKGFSKGRAVWTGFPRDTILEDDGLFWEEACWGLYLTSWLGVIGSGFISGSLLGGILLEVAFLAFLPAIFILQKFTGKEVRDGVLASFNIYIYIYIYIYIGSNIFIF